MTIDWLRPMSLGELLDRTFSLYRSHFLLLVGIMAPQAVLVAATGLANNRLMATSRAGTGGAGTPPDPAALWKGYAVAFPMILVFVLVGWIGGAIVHGAATTAVSRIYLGKAAGVVDSYRLLKGRVGRLVLVSLGVLLRIMGLVCLISVGFWILVIIGAVIHKAVAVAVAVLAGVVAVGVVLRFVLGYVVATPALIVEDSRSGQAIARSVLLMDGHRLRALGITVLMVVIAYAAVLLLQGPFLLLTFMATAQHVEPSVWLAAGLALGQAVSVCLTGPLTLVALVLLYFDLRIRKEAFDLAMLAAGAEEADQALKPPPAPTPGGLNL